MATRSGLPCSRRVRHRRCFRAARPHILPRDEAAEWCTATPYERTRRVSHRTIIPEWARRRPLTRFVFSDHPRTGQDLSHPAIVARQGDFTCIRSRRLVSLLFLCIIGAAPCPLIAQTLFGASGIASVSTTAAAFRSALGPLNPNVSGSFGSGQREINWDGAPDAFAAPSDLSFVGVIFSIASVGRMRIISGNELIVSLTAGSNAHLTQALPAP